MKKKSLVMMLVSLGLVGTVMVGATFAYFTSSTQAVNNTFTVGENVKIELYEDVDQNGNTLSQNHIVITKGADSYPISGSKAKVPAEYDTLFKDMTPGLELEKAPFVENTGSSSYIRVTVTGAKFLAEHGFTVVFNSTDWDKIGDTTNVDGIYQYKKVVTKGEATKPVFTSVTYNKDQTGLAEGVNEEDLKIDVTAYAIQAEGFTNAADAFSTVTDDTKDEISAVLTD